jgi:hypothetical protein
VQSEATHKLPDDAAVKQEEMKLADVFQVKRNQRDLRTGDDPAKHLIGVERLGFNIHYANNLDKLDDKKPDPVVRRTLLVDPSVRAMSKEGTYPQLQQAILDARPGDLILIRHKGTMPVEPINLKKASLDLTIRADTGWQPILTIAESDADDADAWMFRVNDGKVRFENLEFRLQPTKKFRSQSVVTLAGDGQCSFQDCVLTLDPATQETHLAAVTLADNSDVMKMKPPQPAMTSQPPRVVFDNCFVRGAGDLLWNRVSRPLTLELQNSLLALQGNVVNVEVPEPAATLLPASNVNVTIGHTTAYVSGYFVRLKAGKELKGLVPLQCKATGSLFVAAASGQPFIHLDGLAADKDKLKEKLAWSGEQNVYGGYSEMLNQQPLDEDPRPLPIMKADWATFTTDTTSKFVGMMKFPPPSDTPFVRMTPGMFKQMDVAAGAEVEKTPKPSAEDR